MFLQKRFDRQFDYTGDTPIPVCFHNRRPSYYVHTKQCLQEYDMFTGGLLSTIPSGAPVEWNVVQLLASYSKKGQEYAIAYMDNASMAVYDMTRHHFVTATEGYQQSCDIVYAATHGGINPSAFVCDYNSSTINGQCLTAMMNDIECTQDKIGYDIYITAAACSYSGCTLAVGTSDNLVLLYQIGKRGFGDIPEDEQVEEDEPETTLERVINMYSGMDASEDRLRSCADNVNITCISWHPQMKIFAAGRNDSSIVVYSCPLGSWSSTLPSCPYGENIASLCFHPTEPLLFAIVTGATNPPLLTVWTYAPRKAMKLCELYKVHELAEGLSATAVPSLSCHPRENVIMLSFPDGRVLGLSLWDKYTHLGRGMTSASPRQIPFRTFYEGTTEDTMKPLKLPLLHFYTNYALELKDKKPNPKFAVKYRSIREKFSHTLLSLPAAVHGKDGQAIIVRVDGIKISENGMDVVVFLRPEVSEKPREKVLNPDVDPNDPNFDPDDDANYIIKPIMGDDPRRFFVFLPASKGFETIKSWEEREKEEEEEISEEEEKRYWSNSLYAKMPKEDSCQDVLPLNDGFYLMVNQEGTQLEYRECVVKNLKTPTRSPKPDEEPELEYTFQVKSMWKLTVAVKKIFSTPLRTTKNLVVVQYVLEDSDGTQWLVYSKNKDDGNLGYTPMKKKLGLHFHPGEVVCETAWQQIEEGEKPLFAVRTNQRILMVDMEYHILAERPAVVTIGSTMRLTTSIQWLGYTIVYSCSDNRLYYMMGDSRERPIGSLDVHITEPMIVSVLPDRVMYACKNRNDRTTELLSRALVPLEPLVLGLLKAPEGYVKNREQLMMRIIRQYAYKPAEEDPNVTPVGPGYNAGVTNELIRELRKSGYLSVAYAIIRSSGGNKEFPDFPQIAPEIKSDLAMSLHCLNDALQELLCDSPQLMEYLKSAEEGKPFTALLPHPRSTLAERLRSLASLAAMSGDFNTARKCMDLCGDDWNLMQILYLGGDATHNLLEQQASRADGLRPDIKEAAEILAGKAVKSKKRANEAITALNLPQRIPTLLVGGEEASLPTWKLRRVPRIPEIPKPEPLPSQFPYLEMSNVAAWVGASQIVEIPEAEAEAADDPRFGGAAMMVGIEGEDSVVLYLRMEKRDEESATTVFDNSNQANNMTVNGAAHIEDVGDDLQIDKGDGTKVRTLRSLVLGTDAEGKEAMGTLTSKITLERNTLRVGYFHPDVQRRFFTVETWVKYTKQPGYMPLITRGTENDRMWSFGLENGYVVFETTTGKIFTDSSLVPEQTWKHIAATIDCSKKKGTQVTFFVDGKKVKEGEIVSPEREPLDENDQILIGGVNTRARVTELRYWASARSEDDIRDFSKSYLDLAETKGKMKGMVIHDRNCDCEACQKRREKQKAELRKLRGGDVDEEEEEKKPRRGRRGAEKEEEPEEDLPAEPAEEKKEEEKKEEEEDLKLDMGVNEEEEEEEEEEAPVRQKLRSVIRKPIRRRISKEESEEDRQRREAKEAEKRKEREAKEAERRAREAEQLRKLEEEAKKRAEEEAKKKKAEEDAKKEEEAKMAAAAAAAAVAVAEEKKEEPEPEPKKEEPVAEPEPVAEEKPEEPIVEEKPEPVVEEKPEPVAEEKPEPEPEPVAEEPKKEEEKPEEPIVEEKKEEPVEEKKEEEPKAEEPVEEKKEEEPEKKGRRGRRGRRGADKEKAEEAPKEELKEEEKKEEEPKAEEEGKKKKGKKEKKEKKEKKGKKGKKGKEEKKEEEPKEEDFGDEDFGDDIAIAAPVKKAEPVEAIDDEDFDFDEEPKKEEKKEEKKPEPVEAIGDEDFDFDEEPKKEEKPKEEPKEEKKPEPEEEFGDEDFEEEPKKVEEEKKPEEPKEEEKKPEPEPEEEFGDEDFEEPKKEEPVVEEKPEPEPEPEPVAEEKPEEPKEEPKEEKKPESEEEFGDEDFEEEPKKPEEPKEEPKEEKKPEPEEEFGDEDFEEEPKKVEEEKKPEEPKKEEEEFGDEDFEEEKPKEEEKPRRGHKPIKEEPKPEPKPEPKEESEPEPEPEPKEEPKKEEPEPEPKEEKEEEPKRVTRNRSNRKKPEEPKEEKKHHHHHREEGEKRRHHRQKILKEEEPAQPNDEEILGSFGKEEEHEAIGDSEESDKEIPSYNFAAPISRKSRSPTPMRQTVLTAPGRRFVPQKKVQQISDSSDEEPQPRNTLFSARSFSGAQTSGSRATLPKPRMSGFNNSFAPSKPFGANRASTFTRSSSMANRSRNAAMIESDDDDMPMGRSSFAPRPSMAGRSTMGRSIVDNGK